MELCKSSFSLEKQKYSNTHNRTKLLLARIADQFDKDLQINLEKTEEIVEDSQQGIETEEKFKKTAEEDKEDFEETSDVNKKHKAALKIEKEETKLSNILLEMLETERNYVLDLEEVCKSLD
jgi:rubrerythrin